MLDDFEKICKRTKNSRQISNEHNNRVFKNCDNLQNEQYLLDVKSIKTYNSSCHKSPNLFTVCRKEKIKQKLHGQCIFMFRTV